MKQKNDELYLNFRDGRPLRIQKIYLTERELDLLKDRAKVLSVLLGKKISISQITRLKIFYDNNFKIDTNQGDIVDQ